MFDQLCVEGYRMSDVSFGFVGPLLGADDRGQGQEEITRIDGLRLRDHGLAGGEIQMFLTPDNRVGADPGYWYAAKCDHDEQSGEDVVGTIWFRRMSADDTMVDDMSVPLEELDRSHLLDRLISEVLAWHAQACGPGPHGPKDAATPRAHRRK